MYVGRIVAIGCTKANRLTAMYRVSSRSFPNRQTVLREHSAAIVPKPGFETDIMRNPYIAYNCLHLVGDHIAVATNGSQTDPIAEKIASGMLVRDALVTVLHALDFEHDSLDTPRIAAVVDSARGVGHLGIVRKDALLVREFTLSPGQAYYVCTYEQNAPSDEYHDPAFDAADASAACGYILAQGVFAGLERPITAACAVANPGGGFEIAAQDAAAQ